MNKYEIKQLEEKVSEILGHKVEIVQGDTVVPMSKEKPSIDMRLLELENIQKLSIERSKAMKEQRIQNKPLNRLKRKISSFAENSVELAKYLHGELDEVKEWVKNADYKELLTEFLLGESVDDYEEYQPKAIFHGHYNHKKYDVVEKDKVTYLNRDFVDFE